jgi:sulfonate transport system ATP-binding protein
MENSVDNSSILRIQDVSKTFRTSSGDVQAIKKVSLKITRGEFISIIGPSGCGKTTLLRLIAGLETDYEGDILLEGKRIEKPGLDRGVIFQEHRLLPWLTVAQNVALGFEGNKEYVNEQVKIFLEKVGLKGFENVYPGQLSGGMAQRASIARALLRHPKILLLDEPLGALDALTKMNMQAEIERIWMTDKTTMLMVTHDIDEAIFLGDRIIVMTPRPTEINRIIEVNLPRPRNRSSEEFAYYRNMVINEFNASIGAYQI